MPVEESANMILLCAAIAKMEGNADFSARWWPQLTQWEAYLENTAGTPRTSFAPTTSWVTWPTMPTSRSRQSWPSPLTASSAGCAVTMRRAGHYQTLARQYAPTGSERPTTAITTASPSTSRTRGVRNTTWSGTSCSDSRSFRRKLRRRKSRNYKKAIQRYGVPLDSRTHLTKTDWSMWSATLAHDRADFEAIVVADSRLPEPDHRAAAVCRFLRHGQPQKRWHARPSRDRWRFHQDARRPQDLEEMV